MDKRKYIIELPDDEHLISWWTYTGTEDGKQHIDFHEVVKTPYDLDAIRKEAYAEGYKEGMQLSIDDAKLKKEYQRGLNDAWNAARKIVLSREDGGLFCYEERKAVFGCGNYMALKTFLAPEAIEKIRQYEQAQEEQIQVGDEVIGIYSSGEQTNPFVITKWNSDYYFGIYSGSGEFCQGGLKLQKTGRHFPEIAEVFKKMRRKRNDEQRSN